MGKFAIMGAKKKTRQGKYDPKVVINGSFSEVIKVSVQPKEKQPKKAAKGKK